MTTAASTATAPSRATARTAWLFPGQGGEMSGALRVRPGPVTRLLARAGRGLGLDLVRLVVTGDPRLGRTEIAQPALVAVCLGIAQELAERGGVPDVVAGHSLGELSAAAFAGCLSADQAVDLAVERGRSMAACARAGSGTMAAVRAESLADVEQLVTLGRAHGPVVIAAHNAPMQWVLSGARNALVAIARSAPLIFLATDGAWHSPEMEPAEAHWRAALRRTGLGPPLRPLVLNRDGRAATPDDDLAAILAGQLTRPIEWVALLERLVGMGVTRFVALGPGKALRGLCRETLGTDSQVTIESGGPPR